MNKDIAAYGNALKFAFTQAYGGDRADWTAGAEKTNSEGQAVTEFRNAKSGILLQVTGGEEADFAKFSAKRIDAGAGPNEAMNMSIPKTWKSLGA